MHVYGPGLTLIVCHLTFSDQIVHVGSRKSLVVQDLIKKALGILQNNAKLALVSIVIK